MLRSLKLRNWKSFGEEVEFTMLATREQKDGDRLAKIGKTRVLPITALYGPNASGKSVLIESLGLLKHLVHKSRNRGELMPITPHLLHHKNEATTFGVEFSVAGGEGQSSRDTTFYYEVTVTARAVEEESLYLVQQRKELCLFERSFQEIELYEELGHNPLVHALAQTVLPNRLFLETLYNADTPPAIIKTALRWFDELVIITKQASYVFLPQRIAADKDFKTALGNALSTADTGITAIDFQTIAREQVPIDGSALNEIEATFRVQDTTEAVIQTGDGDFFRLVRTEGQDIEYQLLVTIHSDQRNGSESFTLPLSAESDGTSRYLNLIPAFLLLEEGKRGVILIDEIEDSLHPLLTEKLVSTFLEGTGETQRQQLIFTTHELHLMSSGLLRRDEIWHIEKQNHSSTLTRFADFSAGGLRKGADQVSFYTSGRLGGVPKL